MRGRDNDAVERNARTLLELRLKEKTFGASFPEDSDIQRASHLYASAVENIGKEQYQEITEEQLFMYLRYPPYTKTPSKEELNFREESIKALYRDALIRADAQQLNILKAFSPPNEAILQIVGEVYLDLHARVKNRERAPNGKLIPIYFPIFKEVITGSLQIPQDTIDQAFKDACKEKNVELREQQLNLFSHSVSEEAQRPVGEILPSSTATLDVLTQAVKANDMELINALKQSRWRSINNFNLTYDDFIALFKTVLETSEDDVLSKETLMKTFLACPHASNENFIHDMHPSLSTQLDLHIFMAACSNCHMDMTRFPESLHIAAFQELYGQKEPQRASGQFTRAGFYLSKPVLPEGLSPPNVAYYWHVVKKTYLGYDDVLLKIFGDPKLFELLTRNNTNVMVMNKIICEDALKQNDAELIQQVLTSTFFKIPEAEASHFLNQAIEKANPGLIQIFYNALPESEKDKRPLFKIVSDTMLKGNMKDPDSIIKLLGMLVGGPMPSQTEQLATFSRCYHKLQKKLTPEQRKLVSPLVDAIDAAVELSHHRSEKAKTAGNEFVSFLRKTADCLLNEPDKGKKDSALKTNIAEIENRYNEHYKDFKRSPMLSAACDLLAGIASLTIAYGIYLYSKASQKYKETGNVRLFTESTEQQKMNTIKSKLEGLKPKADPEQKHKEGQENNGPG